MSLNVCADSRRYDPGLALGGLHAARDATIPSLKSFGIIQE